MNQNEKKLNKGMHSGICLLLVHNKSLCFMWSKSLSSIGSFESASSVCSANTDETEEYFIYLFGDRGVGKRALIDKFLPSPQDDDINSSFGK